MTTTTSKVRSPLTLARCALIYLCAADRAKKTPPTGAHDYRVHNGINYCVCTGALDGVLDDYVENETPSTLDTVIKIVLKKVPRSLAWGIEIQLLDDICSEFETAEMAVEDATIEAEEATRKNAFTLLLQCLLYPELDNFSL